MSEQSNPIIITNLSHVDPAATPLDINELIDLLNPRLHSEITGGIYLAYIIGHDTPGPNDTNKAWIELDTQGRPIALKVFWHGAWRRVYNGMLGQITMFSGDPSNTTNWTVGGPNEGRGVAGGIYDGWAICNGKNGTPDLSDRFIIGAHMNNVDHPGYDTDEGGWVTWISNDKAEHEGGVRDITLNAENTYRPPRHEVKVDRWAAADNARSESGQLWGELGNGGVGQNPFTLLGEDAGNTEPQSISTIPPFIALGYIQFIGYPTT